MILTEVPTHRLTRAGRSLRRRHRHLVAITTEASADGRTVPMTDQELEALEVALDCIAAVLDERGCDPQLVAKVTHYKK